MEEFGNMDKINSLNNLQIIFNRVLERFLQTVPQDRSLCGFIQNNLSDYLKLRGAFKSRVSFESKNQPQLIIDLYQDLNQLKKEISPKLEFKKISIVNRFDYDRFKNLGWQYRVIYFLQKQIDKKLNKFVNCFLVHGSFATRDFLEDWSDLDTKIVLKDTIFESTENLNYARKQFAKLSFLCDKIDPLSHHRFSFLTDFDLNYYSRFFLPLVVYKHSLLLNGVSEIRINLRNDKQEQIRQMNNFVDYFRNKVLNKTYSRNLSCWKDDLAHIMLWPCLMLQAKGISVYKKYSFEKSKQEFPSLDFSLVDEATAIMRDWFRPNVLRYYPNFLFTFLPFRLNQTIVNQYRNYLNRRSIQQTAEEVERFTERSLSFLEESFGLISNNLGNEN